jgi:hypothetical protein
MDCLFAAMNHCLLKQGNCLAAIDQMQLTPSHCSPAMQNLLPAIKAC